jgi:hypothetical protein
VYAVDLPGHGHSPIDKSVQYDEPYMRKGIVGLSGNPRSARRDHCGRIHRRRACADRRG